MKFRTAGTDYHSLPLPLFDAAGTEGNGDPNGNGDGVEKTSDGSFVFDAGKAYADLDADTRAWLQTVGVDKDPKALATKAYNQEKLLGNRIPLPGKDATPEELNEFYAKLGRPETADKYELKAPADMPEGLPYDGEFAKRAAAEGHKLGLTQAQMAGLHDFWVTEQVGMFNGAVEGNLGELKAKADAAKEGLTKLWGPEDSPTYKANLEIADKVFTMVPGGQEVLEELKGLGLVGPNKEVLSLPLAKMFAALGSSLYKEGEVLRGNPDVIGNVFDSTSDAYNMTEQHKLAKSDPAKAASLIRAAGKKPTDFGLPADFGA
jgi:hypothetical protein